MQAPEDANGRQPARPTGPVHLAIAAVVVSLLLGLATAMVVAGLSRRFTAAFVETVSVQGVTAVALISVAIGVRVPQRFAVWMALRAWRRFLSSERYTDLSDAILRTEPVDRSLHWMVTSIVALVAGIAAALLPLTAALGLGCCRWVEARFVWSFGLQRVPQAMTMLAVGFVVLAVLGLAIALAHRLVAPGGQWDPRVTAWLLAGAAGGTLISTWLARAAVPVDLGLIAPALPALVASVIVACCRPIPHLGTGQTNEPSTAALPLLRDRRPAVLRASLVLVGGGCAWVVAVWCRCFAGGGGAPAVAPSALILSLGVGYWLGCGMRFRKPRSVGGFGVACVASGVVLAGALFMVFGVLNVSSTTATALACVSTASLGHAMGFGDQTLLNRVASRPRAGALMLARIMLCAAVMVWLAAPLAVDHLGAGDAMGIAMVTVVGLGASLIVLEPAGSRRARMGKLAAVFTLIALIGGGTWRVIREADRPEGRSGGASATAAGPAHFHGHVARTNDR